MNLITPIVLIIISAGLFFGYVDRQYRGENNPQSVKALLAEQNEYNTTLESTNSIVTKRDTLITKQSSISKKDLERLSKLMPNSVDNVRLIVDMDALARRYSNTGLKNINISKESSKDTDSSNVQVSNTGENNYNYLTVGFTISTTYQKFVDFLKDLESNLRLADVKTVSFSSNDNGVYDYSVTVKTYWLK